MSGTARVLRSAEVIAVGSELLGSSRLDTNSLYLADRLATVGIVLRAKAVVGDNRTDLAAVFSGALARADVVILTGGLGPTDDDLTREVIATVLERPLIEDPEITAAIERRFASRGMRMPAVNRRQAMVPRGATVLSNPNGTAPGLLLEVADKVVVLTPGPPREMQPIIEHVLTTLLADRLGDERLHRAVLFIAGRGESHVEEVAQPIYSRWLEESPPIETTILAAPAQVELHLTLRSADAGAGRARVERARDDLARALGDAVFSTDGRSLEEVVGRLLLERRLTIAVAESCTGGLLTSRLTDVPGSSAYVLAGVVAYSNAAKTALAGVDPELIAAHGAVSEPVASALAAGIRARAGADIGVGVTGIAGPGGATPGKPVGTVAVAISGAAGDRARTFALPGGRAQVKFAATQMALDMVRRRLVHG